MAYFEVSKRKKQCPDNVCPYCNTAMSKKSTVLGILYVCADCHWWEGVEEAAECGDHDQR